MSSSTINMILEDCLKSSLHFIFFTCPFYIFTVTLYLHCRSTQTLHTIFFPFWLLWSEFHKKIENIYLALTIEPHVNGSLAILLACNLLSSRFSRKNSWEKHLPSLWVCLCSLSVLFTWKSIQLDINSYLTFLMYEYATPFPSGRKYSCYRKIWWHLEFLLFFLKVQ